VNTDLHNRVVRITATTRKEPIMGRSTRNTPEPDTEPVEHVWSLDEMIGDRIEDAAAAAEGVTGVPRVAPNVPTGDEITAAKAAGKPIEILHWTCGTCSTSVPLNEFYANGHRCELSARQAGRKERFLREQELARRAANPGFVCQFCNADVPAGAVHRCTPAVKLLPHDQAALEWQQQGARQALKDLVGSTDEADGAQAS